MGLMRTALTTFVDNLYRTASLCRSNLVLILGLNMSGFGQSVPLPNSRLFCNIEGDPENTVVIKGCAMSEDWHDSCSAQKWLFLSREAVERRLGVR